MRFIRSALAQALGSQSYSLDSLTSEKGLEAMFHWEIKDKVESLKREGKYDEAIKLLADCIDFTEQRAYSDGRTLYAWPYEQTAILFRKLKRHDDEVDVLERFIIKQSSFDNQFIKLSERLGKAYLLTRQAEKRTENGVQDLYHLNDQVPVHSRDKFKRRGLVVDVETTGLSARDELIEFGAVLFLVMSGRWGKREEGVIIRGR